MDKIIKKINLIKTGLTNANDGEVMRALFQRLYSIIQDNNFNKSYLTQLEQIPFIHHSGTSTIHANKITLNGIIEDLLIDMDDAFRSKPISEKALDLVPINEPHNIVKNKNQNNQNMIKIFISHSSKDEAKIKPLIDLIEVIGIPHSEIFF